MTSPQSDGGYLAKLGDVCIINPLRPDNFKRDAATPTTFVPMTAVDDKEGRIVKPEIRAYREVARGYTYFAEGDVIFAKITPCMQNGKAAIARNLIDGVGFGSTEFHVLRPSDRVLSEWIWHYVRQESFRRMAERSFIGGAGQQRVPEEFMRQSLIPIPPLHIQQEQVAEIERQFKSVTRMQTAAERQLEAAKAMTGALLREVFESEEARHWNNKPLAELTTKIGSGQTPQGGRSVYLSEGIPLIRSMNVHNNYFVRKGLVHISSETNREMSNSRVLPGDVLLNITGASIGRACVVPDDVCPANVNQHVSIIRPISTLLDSDFLSLTLTQPKYQKEIMATQAGATRQALTQKQIEGFIIPLPASLAEQQSIAGRLKEKIRRAGDLREQAERQQEATDAMPATILRGVFSKFTSPIEIENSIYAEA